MTIAAAIICPHVLSCLANTHTSLITGQFEVIVFSTSMGLTFSPPVTIKSFLLASVYK